MDSSGVPKKGIIIGIIILVLVGAGIYMFFFRNDKTGENPDGDGDEDVNRSPLANAGFDQTVEPGEIFELDASGSTDPDGDELQYYWDMDIGTDTNGDGIFDNDRDREGVKISYSYPSPDSTTTYIVTLNASDDSLWDRSTVRITVIVNGTEDDPPEIEMSCRYQSPPLGLPGEPQFILTVNSVSRNESFMDFLYVLEDPDGEVLEEGTVLGLINLSTEEDIRYIDTPPTMGDIDDNDIFMLKENDSIVEGCNFTLYYLYNVEASGSVELTK